MSNKKRINKRIVYLNNGTIINRYRYLFNNILVNRNKKIYINENKIESTPESYFIVDLNGDEYKFLRRHTNYKKISLNR